MSSVFPLTPHLVPGPQSVARAPASVRLARYTTAIEPPELVEFQSSHAGIVLEEAVDATVELATVPALAVREVVENLVHAHFEDALISVCDGGATVRVSDAGPGIGDVEGALRPGFTTAGAAERELIRGAGAGLPLVASLLANAAGQLDIQPNLAGGAVVTLAVPVETGGAAPVAGPSDLQRAILALLLELESAAPDMLARETGSPLAACGRELAVLEHRGLVVRGPARERTLTDAGRELVAALF